MHAELDLSITGTEDARADEDDDDHIDVIGDVFADRCTGFEMHKIRVELRGIRQRPLDAVSTAAATATARSTADGRISAN